MFKHGVFLVFLLLTSGSVLAQTSTVTLFAVDVSLSDADKAAAFDVITEVTGNAPETQSVGLTLFDDTVRDYVAPSHLDTQQVNALNKAVAEAQNSVRSTSNVAVGIERAIDAFSPEGGANLVVFSRGIIDTETEDPRARFNEWLDKILLTQAATSNIAITLVVPQNLTTDKPIEQAFDKSDLHQITSIASGTSITPQLMNLLNIPDRAYGSSAASGPLAANETSEANGERSTIQTATPNTEAIPAPDELPMTRMILLALASTLLIGIVSWRYFSRSTRKGNNDVTMPSSTYLPLNEKPSDTMDYWIERDTDVRTERSTGAATKPMDSEPTVQKGSGKTVKR